ncbi:hypothetical protein NQZ68_038970 [Dissostichus eleginoides]|nr:hypothetical protein NQZ68_038970 [Dissostichus eleginoides]
MALLTSSIPTNLSGYTNNPVAARRRKSQRRKSRGPEEPPQRPLREGSPGSHFLQQHHRSCLVGVSESELLSLSWIIILPFGVTDGKTDNIRIQKKGHMISACPEKVGAKRRAAVAVGGGVQPLRSWFLRTRRFRCPTWLHFLLFQTFRLKCANGCTRVNGSDTDET